MTLRYHHVEETHCNEKTANSVLTVSVMAVTLGLAVWCSGDLDIHVGQLLCASAVLDVCCLAPVQAISSVAQLSSNKNSMISIHFCSGAR